MGAQPGKMASHHVIQNERIYDQRAREEERKYTSVGNMTIIMNNIIIAL